MTSIETGTEFEVSPEQKYELDLRGYFVLRGHYDEDAIRGFHAGIDELQAIPVEYEAYQKLGVATYALARSIEDSQHPVWKGEHRADRPLNPKTGGLGEINHALCGTGKFDPIVRDPILNTIHSTLAGGAFFISATYFIEKVGPAIGGGLHNGGYPVDRDIYYAYDHTNQRFACSSTKSVVILSDMTRIESGPFAAIPGSHNAYPVTDDSIRRSVFFNYMPAIGRNNLPDQRISIYPDHVLERLSDQVEILSSPGYI